MTIDTSAYDLYGDEIVSLVQWDRDIYIYLNIDNVLGMAFMNFFNNASDISYVVDTEYENGKLKAKIPNVLLQDPKPIIGYVCLSNDVSKRGVARVRFNVRPMPKPSSFIPDAGQDYLRIESVLEECREYAESARLHEENTKALELSTAESERNSLSNAKESENSAKISQSWAIGNSGLRDGEDTDNSKYYSEQSKYYKESVENSANMSKSYTVGGTGLRDGEDTDNIKYYYEKAVQLDGNYIAATIDELSQYLGIDLQ